MLRLVVGTTLRYRRPPGVPEVRNLAPPVNVNAVLGDSFDGLKEVTGPVELTTSDGPVIEIRTIEQDRLLTVEQEDSDSIDVLYPVDQMVWTAEGFTTEPPRRAANLGDLIDAVDDRSRRRRLELAHLRQFLWCTTDSQNDPIGTAQAIIELAMARVPLAGTLTEQTAELVGSEIAALVQGVDAATLSDNTVRERYATQLRSAALTDHTARGWVAARRRLARHRCCDKPVRVRTAPLQPT